MSQASKPVREAAFLRLPVELIQEIAGYIRDPNDLCAFVSSCRQTYYYVGKDLVHVQCAKAGAEAFASSRTDSKHREWKSTLDCAAKGTDKDVFAWILDIYIAHYPQCLNRWPELSPGNDMSYGPLNTAIKYHNFEVFQLLLDRGAEILRPGHEPRWDAMKCPLWLAVKSSSIDVARSLIAADHLTNRVHAEQAVVSNNVELAEMVCERAIQAIREVREELAERGGWALNDTARDFCEDIPFDLVFKHGEDKDTRMLDFLIRKGKPIDEIDIITRRREHVNYPLSHSAPVGIALTSKCPQTAISLLRQQIQKDLHEPIMIRDIIDRVCRHYSEDQRGEHGKSPEFHSTYMTFVEGFHPEFTPYLFRHKHPHLRDMHEDLREGCDFLLSTVLQNCSPSHEVVSYLLANGCTVSTDMLLAELYQVWKSASHCLTRKGRHPNIPVCEGCHESDGVQSRFADKQCSLKTSLSRLDSLLDLMSTEAIDAIGTVTEAIYFNCDCDYSACDGCYEDRQSITTPLDFAVSRGLWIVAYRLLHYGADLFLLNKRSKDTIRKMYKETFANGGDIHPLVLDAWDGKFVPDKVEFSSGIDPKRDEQRQALALVMMTTGLKKPPQDKSRDSAGRKGVSHQKRFTGHRR